MVLVGKEDRNPVQSCLTNKNGEDLLFHRTVQARTQLMRCHLRIIFSQSEALLLVDKHLPAAQDYYPTASSALGERDSLFQ